MRTDTNIAQVQLTWSTVLGTKNWALKNKQLLNPSHPDHFYASTCDSGCPWTNACPHRENNLKIESRLLAHFNGLPSLRITATAAALDTHGRLKDLKLLQDLFFLVTTSLCQDWVTCLHAAFLTCGNRFYHSGLSVQGPSLDLRYPSFACSANTLPSEAARWEPCVTPCPPTQKGSAAWAVALNLFVAKKEQHVSGNKTCKNVRRARRQLSAGKMQLWITIQQAVP